MSEFKEQINKLTNKNKPWTITNNHCVVARFLREPSHTYELFNLDNINKVGKLKIKKNALILVGNQAYLVENKKLVLDENKNPKMAKVFLSPDEAEYLKDKQEKINKDDKPKTADINWDGLINETRVSIGISPKDYAYYVFDLKDVLGKGGFGEVYAGYSLDYESGKPGKPMVGKFIQTDKFDYQESKRIHGYFLTHDAITVGNEMLLPMERLPGENLGTFIKSGKLDQLSAAQRIDLTLQIMLSLNVIHHETGYTGSAIIHGDIKPDNIQVSIDNKGRVNGYVLDFGVSSEIEDAKDTIKKYAGTPIYMAPEVLTKSEMKIESDIFSLGLAMASLLGADQEVKKFVDQRVQVAKEYLKTKDKTHRVGMGNLAPPSLENLLKDQIFSKFQPDIKRNTQLFLNRMLEKDPEKRPNTDECLRFFTTLSTLSHAQELFEKSNDTKEKNEFEDSLNDCRIKLKILASPNMDWKKKNEYLKQFDFSVYTGLKQKMLEAIIQPEGEIEKLLEQASENLELLPKNITKNNILSVSNPDQILLNQGQAIFLFGNKINTSIDIKNKALNSLSSDLKSILENLENINKLLEPMKINQLLTLTKEARQHQTEIIQLFGKEVYQTLGKSLIKKYVDYKNCLNPDGREGWFGYTNKQKANAAQNLLDVLDGKKAALDPKAEKILNQGRLGQLAKIRMKEPDNSLTPETSRKMTK